MKFDVDGKRVSIPESMCQKVLGKLLAVNNTPSEIFISQRDPSYKGAPPCSHRPRAIDCPHFIAAQICLMPSLSSVAAALRA